MTSQEIPKSPERLAILEKIAQYEREGAAFVPKYKKLLRTTTVATAEDVAKVALFLASDLSSYVSGQVIHCCGAMNC